MLRKLTTTHSTATKIEMDLSNALPETLDFDDKFFSDMPLELQDLPLNDFTPLELAEVGSPHPDTLSGDEEHRLAVLETGFSSFVKETNARMASIESGIDKILTTLTFATGQCELKQAPAMFAMPTPTSTSPALEPETLSFDTSDTDLVPTMVVGEHDTLWYTKRPFKPFDVILLDQLGLPYTKTQNWQVTVRLLNGHGLYVDQFLFGHSLTFPVVDGTAHISGIKFSAVTSRNGGFFELEVAVTNPASSAIAPARSRRLRILSERLKNESKAATIHDLGPDDSLLRVPGIGKKYRSRFAALGIRTLRDLANVTPDSELAYEIQQVLREERGALTEDKLNVIIADCVEILHREQNKAKRELELVASEAAEFSFSMSNKRQCVGSDMYQHVPGLSNTSASMLLG